MRFESVWGSETAAKAQAEKLALIFGGSNMVEGVGRWYDDDGKLWLEPSFTVTVHVAPSYFNAQQVHNSITRGTLDDSDQLSVLVVLPNGDHYFMERDDE